MEAVFTVWIHEAVALVIGSAQKGGVVGHCKDAMRRVSSGKPCEEEKRRGRFPDAGRQAYGQEVDLVIG